MGDADKIAAAIKDGQWNDVTIIARGNRLIQKINGLTTVDVTDEDTAARAAAGLLGLQLHRGKPMRIEFKDIRLREFAPQK